MEKMTEEPEKERYNPKKVYNREGKSIIIVRSKTNVTLHSHKTSQLRLSSFFCFSQIKVFRFFFGNNRRDYQFFSQNG